VIQNASLNSSLSQFLAVAATTGEPTTAFGDANAQLSALVLGNVAAGDRNTVDRNDRGHEMPAVNLISERVANDAIGLFNVLQNQSINSAVQQNLSLAITVR